MKEKSYGQLLYERFYKKWDGLDAAAKRRWNGHALSIVGEYLRRKKHEWDNWKKEGMR